MFDTAKVVARMLFVGTIFASTFSPAQCSIHYVILKGRAEGSLRNGLVRVQLVYRKHSKPQLGESGEVTLDQGLFRLQVPFLTQSRAPALGIGKFGCDRKPKTAIVTLVQYEREYDRVSLDLAKDFTMADLSAYTLRTEIVLHGPH